MAKVKVSAVKINDIAYCLKGWEVEETATFQDTTGTCDNGFESEELASQSVVVRGNAQLDLSEDPACNFSNGDEVSIKVYVDGNVNPSWTIPVATVRRNRWAHSLPGFVTWDFEAKSKGSYTRDCVGAS